MHDDLVRTIHAVVSNGVVVNLILWDGEDEQFAQVLLPSLLVAVPEDTVVSVGDLYDGTDFVSSAALPNAHVAVPQSVTMRQARLALLATGHLEAVVSAIDALPAPHRDAARIEWEYAATIERSSSITKLLCDALGLDATELDTLFLEASKR